MFECTGRQIRQVSKPCPFSAAVRVLRSSNASRANEISCYTLKKQKKMRGKENKE